MKKLILIQLIGMITSCSYVTEGGDNIVIRVSKTSNNLYKNEAKDIILFTFDNRYQLGDTIKFCKWKQEYYYL